MNPRKFNKPICIDIITGAANRTLRLIKAMDGNAPINPHTPGIHTTIGVISVARSYARSNRIRRGMKREIVTSAVAAVNSMINSKTKVLKPPGK